MELKPHEIKVIDMLVSGVVSSDILSSIKSNPDITDYYTTGHGYFLTITNSDLPARHIICHEPMIIDKSSGV